MKTVILIFDQLPAFSIGCFGGGASTPNIDNFAATADLFTNCYSDRSCNSLETWIHTKNPTSILSLNEWSPNIIDNDQALQLCTFSSNFGASEADAVIESLRNIDCDASVIVTAKQGFSESSVPEEQQATSKWHSTGEYEAHVPLIIKQPTQNHSRRRTDLITTVSLPEMVDCLHSSAEKYSQWRNQQSALQIEYRSETEIAVRTNHWLLMRPIDKDVSEQTIDSLQLYRKPEDLWEILNVVDQYPQVIDNYMETGNLDFPKA